MLLVTYSFSVIVTFFAHVGITASSNIILQSKQIFLMHIYVRLRLFILSQKTDYPQNWLYLVPLPSDSAHQKQIIWYWEHTGVDITIH